MKKFDVKNIKVGDLICIEIVNQVDNFMYEIPEGSKQYWKVYKIDSNKNPHYFMMKRVDKDEKLMFLTKWFDNTDTWKTEVACLFPMIVKLYFCDEEDLLELSFKQKFVRWFNKRYKK